MYKLFNKLFGRHYIWVKYKWCGGSVQSSVFRVKKTIDDQYIGNKMGEIFFIYDCDPWVDSATRIIEIMHWKRLTDLGTYFPKEYTKETE